MWNVFGTTRKDRGRRFWSQGIKGDVLPILGVTPIVFSGTRFDASSLTETVSLDGLEIEDTINSINKLAAG